MDVIVFKDDYGRIDGRPYILDVRGENFYLTEEEFTGLAVSIVDIVESRRQE